MKATEAISRIIFLLPVLFVLAAIFIPIGAQPFEQTDADDVYFEYIPPEKLKAPPKNLEILSGPSEPISNNGYYYLDEIPMSYGWQYYTQAMCEKYDVEYSVMLGLFETESGFDFTADSGLAYGIGQIGYINFDWLTEKGIDPWTKQGNIEASAMMLSDLLFEYGDPHIALMAYNCGETGAEELMDNGIYETTYSTLVLERASKWGNYICDVYKEET